MKMLSNLPSTTDLPTCHRSTPSWHSLQNHFTRRTGCLKEKPGPFHQICLRPVPNWSVASVHTSY